MVSDTVAAVVGCLLQPGGEESLVSYLAFSDTIPQMVFRNLITVWQGWKSRLSTWPLLTWVGWGTMFYLVSGYNMVGLSKCFPVPPSFLVLWLEREGSLLRLFFFLVCAQWHLWIAVYFSSNTRFLRQKENPGNSHYIVPWVLRS